MRARIRRVAVFPAVVLVGLAGWDCAVNPATGERQLSLIGEGQEIEMGRQAAEQVEAQIGLYADRALQSYVGGVGMGLARASERPDLPWSFQVADDHVVNAFALPGGFIYVTRGILAHFDSEAELAAVLGHEIGHVTARHSVERISRAQLAGLGLGLGAVLFEPMRGALGEVAGLGLNLLFLSYSRDDERQADALGVRYAVREGYDPREAIDVFEMLQAQAELSDGGSLPNWLSTHPTPEDRIERLRAQIDTLSPSVVERGRVEREGYLRRLDGLVFGPNPRHGFFQDNLFLHPEMEFQIQLPEGWGTRNMARAVLAVSPREDALIELTLAEGTSHREAAQLFFSRQGIRSGGVSRETINGIPATVGSFQASTQQGTLEGLAAFLDYGGRTFRILGYAPQGRFGSYRGTVQRSIGSFRRLTDRRALRVQPMRLRAITVQRSTTIAELHRTRGAPVEAARLAVLNGVRTDESIPSGRLIKWVEGEPPPTR